MTSWRATSPVPSTASDASTRAWSSSETATPSIPLTPGPAAFLIDKSPAYVTAATDRCVC
mgnify:CR=1 FL=1